MSKHLVSPFTPPTIAPERHASNGMLPSVQLGRRLASTFNWCSCVQKRQFLLRSMDIADIAAGDASDQICWPTFFRTGENTTGVSYAVGLAMVDLAASSPYAEIIVRRFSDDNIMGTIRLDYNALVSTADTSLDEIAHRFHSIRGLSPNTDYFSYTVLHDGARLAYMSGIETMIRHADDTVDGVCDPGGFVDEGPLYASQIADLVNANNLLWQHNGAHLFEWSTNFQSSAPSISATSYTNPFDSTTSVTTHTKGVNLFTQYHNTINRTTVPVRIAVRADRTSGAGSLDVRLTDGTNSVALTGITSAGIGDWYVGTGTMPPQNGTKWDLQAKVSAGTFDLHAVCLSEYEA